MQQTWLEDGPVDELANTIADLIIGDPELNAVWIEKWRRLPREAMQAPGDCLFTRDDITPRVGEIMCPAIVIHGTADRSIEIELAEQLCHNLPGCVGLVRVQGGPHASNLTHPGGSTHRCSSSCAACSRLALHAERARGRRLGHRALSRGSCRARDPRDWS